MKEFGLGRKMVSRTRNMLALGLVSWLYSRDLRPTRQWLQQRFADDPPSGTSTWPPCKTASGGENTGTFVRCVTRSHPPGEAARPLPAGLWRPGLGVGPDQRIPPPACRCSSAPTRLPPRPTSCTELAKRKSFGVHTFQAEDEIALSVRRWAARPSAALSVSVPPPGRVALKRDDQSRGDDRTAAGDHRRAAGRAVTRHAHQDEQGDLLQALAGRNGESPVPVIAAQSPADCFDAAIRPIGLRSPAGTRWCCSACLPVLARPWRSRRSDHRNIDPGFAKTPDDGEVFEPTGMIRSP